LSRFGGQYVAVFTPSARPFETRPAVLFTFHVQAGTRQWNRHAAAKSVSSSDLLSVACGMIGACDGPADRGSSGAAGHKGRRAVRRPVTDEVHVHYGQIYVESDPDGAIPEPSEAFAGQRGGLCGAAVPGVIWLITGLHTGDVGFVVEVHEENPPLDPVWEDVVEVSFRPVSERTSLVQWAGEATWDLDLARTDYRVRYCAVGMDKGRELDTRVAGEPQADSYLLQFWPAPPRADRVVRQTSQTAAYWHRYARELPAPPTPEQRAETERLARQA
jgi:hypothetical protein